MLVLGFRRVRRGNASLNLRTDFRIRFVDRLVRLVAPPFDDFTYDWELAVLIVHSVKQAVFRFQKDEHLFVFGVVVFGAPHAGSCQYIQLLEREIAVDYVDWRQHRQLTVLAFIVSPVYSANFDTSDED